MEEHNSLKLSQKIIVIVADLLILAELCFGMYQASLAPDEITPVFMKAFLPLALPTVVAAIVAIRYLKRRRPDPAGARP